MVWWVANREGKLGVVYDYRFDSFELIVCLSMVLDVRDFDNERWMDDTHEMVINVKVTFFVEDGLTFTP